MAGFVVGALFVSAVFGSGSEFDGRMPVCAATDNPVRHPRRVRNSLPAPWWNWTRAHIKVTRTLVGRPDGEPQFCDHAATKMNKTAIKVHNRVTVRYKRLPEGDLALEIQPETGDVRDAESVGRGGSSKIAANFAGCEKGDFEGTFPAP